MSESGKQMTHIVWSQHYRGGRFREWVEVGMGRIEFDVNGQPVVHSYQNRIARGDNGYTCMIPIGTRPPDPQPQARRPDRQDEHDGD
jgi:hypothetical protein